MEKSQVNAIIAGLEELYPEAGPQLEFANPLQLLIATILSAQCTDVRVNIVTKPLFERCHSAADFAALSQEELETAIKSVGFYHNKAKNLRETCRIIAEKYNGEVPSSREDLEALPGVGRKTANVVLSNAFGVPAIAVDTHVFRVTNRLGVASADNVLDTEKQICEAFPEEKWSKLHHMILWHGRRVCHSQKPDCENCTLRCYCRYYAEKG